MRRYIGATEFSTAIDGTALLDDDERRGGGGDPADRRAPRAGGRRARRQAGSNDAQSSPTRRTRSAATRITKRTAIVVPLHSSESRDYIPIGFLDAKTVVSNACSAIYGAEPWLFRAADLADAQRLGPGGCGRARDATQVLGDALLQHLSGAVDSRSGSASSLTERAFAVLGGAGASLRQDAGAAVRPGEDAGRAARGAPVPRRGRGPAVPQAAVPVGRRALELLFDMYETATGDGARARGETGVGRCLT